MNRFAILITALSLSTSSAAFAADGTFEKNLSVSGMPSVSVSTGSGYLHIYSGPDNQIHIVGHVHSHSGMFGSDSEADAKVQRIVSNPPIKQNGNIVSIGSSSGDSSLFQNISIDYDVITPRSTTLKAHTGSGSMEIGGIEGGVIANSGSGELKVENIGANSRLDTGSGSIHASNVHGAATLQTGSGSLDLDLSGAGDVTAHTGSGSIHIRGLNGALRASTGSGGIEASGNPTSEWRLQSGSGGIRVDVGPSAKFTLNADTGSGTIHIEQPILMQGSLNKHHVYGTVNGGGPTIRTSTGSGSITIH